MNESPTRTVIDLNLNWMPHFQFVVDSNGKTTIESNLTDILKSK